MGRYVIPPGQDALLEQLLAPDTPTSGWELVSARVEGEAIAARYRRVGGGAATATLVHVSRRGADDLSTAKFAVAASTPELASVVARAVEKREADFTWQEILDASPRAKPDPARSTVDVQWVAFRAGIKPAIRVSAQAGSAAGIAERYREAGASVVQSPPLTLRRRAAVVVYVAGSAAEADELFRLERSLLATRAWRRQRELGAELGVRLGYPQCCTHAFVVRNHGSLLRRQPVAAYLRARDSFRAAQDAATPRPVARLNQLLMREHRSFISFDPCRYDCRPALALADRIAAAAAAEDPEWAAFVDRELARPIVVARNGARAFVEVTPGGSRRNIARAWAPRAPDGTSQAKDERLAVELVGRDVVRGRVRGTGSIVRPLLVDFAARDAG